MIKFGIFFELIKKLSLLVPSKLLKTRQNCVIMLQLEFKNLEHALYQQLGGGGRGEGGLHYRFFMK